MKRMIKKYILDMFSKRVIYLCSQEIHNFKNFGKEPSIENVRDQLFFLPFYKKDLIQIFLNETHRLKRYESLYAGIKQISYYTFITTTTPDIFYSALNDVVVNMDEFPHLDICLDQIEKCLLYLNKHQNKDFVNTRLYEFSYYFKNDFLQFNKPKVISYEHNYTI